MAQRTKPALRFAHVLLAAWLLSAASSGQDRVAARQKQPIGRSIRGEVEINPPGRAFEKASLIVYVEPPPGKIQDARINRLAELTIRDISHDGRPGAVIPFSLGVFQPDRLTGCRLRVLVDLDNNNRISKGDYRTPSAIPIPKEADPAPLKIRAELR